MSTVTITITRDPSLTGAALLGKFSCSGFTGHTLERNDVKVKTGTFRASLYQSGKLERQVIYLNDSDTGREAIEIHNGNWIHQTEGCILVGDSRNIQSNGNGMVLHSVKTLDKLLAKCKNKTIKVVISGGPNDDQMSFNENYDQMSINENMEWCRSRMQSWLKEGQLKDQQRYQDRIGKHIENIRREADDLLGGIELSLTSVDFSNLYGFNFDSINKTIMALCKKSTNKTKDNDEDEKNTNQTDTDTTLDDADSILKKYQNDESIMVWEHFCVFLKMFNEVGDRQSVSFSLDPAEKLEQGKSNQNVKMKKVYYPENLRWSKVGEIMFDADLFIKTLLYDMHPDITKHIPNYESYIQKTLNNTGWNDESSNDESNWHRLWVVLDEIEQCVEGKSIMIEKVKFKINVRKMNIESDGELHDDLGNNEDNLLTQFVDHINQNMDIIHQHSLFLQRLEGVFRALILAKFAYNNNIPFNIDLIDKVCNKQKQQLQKLGIKFKIPSLVKTESKHREIRKGNYLMKQTSSRTFSGGIDLNISQNNTKTTNKLSQKLKSINKLFDQINQTISKMKVGRKNDKIMFQKLCDFSNKDSDEYTAILFPDVIFDCKNEKLCDDDDCKQVISWQKQFIFEDKEQKKQYCLKHYEDRRYTKCVKCGEGIDRLNDEYRIMQSNDNELIHESCMKCDECREGLSGRQTIMDKEKHMFCSEQCANQYMIKSLPNKGDNVNHMICSKCNKSILGGYVRFGDDTFIHSGCLKCDECGQAIQCSNTIMDGDKNIFCGKACANKKAMKEMGNKVIGQCHKCRQNISAIERDICEMQDMMLHRRCMVCYQCGNVLNGGVAMDGQKNMFCSAECGTAFHGQ